MAGGLELIGLDEIFRKALAPVLERLAGGTAFEFALTFPITKVDVASRTVEGVATSETRDLQGEQVSYDASKRAFADWSAKNIREMHGALAVGKAISVVANDAAKNIVVKSRISRGAESTLIKCQEGVLQAYSIGGTRLRSTMLPDGTRRTDEYRLNELSLVDNPANPDCSIKIVKSLSGVPTVTDIIAADTEADYFLLADAVDAVAIQLRAGCRPLPQEVTRALNFAGSSITCDMLAPDDFNQRGPQIAADLKACSTALRQCCEVADLEKARTAAVFALSTLPCRRDLARAREKGHRSGTWNAEGRGLSVESLREEIAKCLGQLRGMQGSAETVETLEKNVMQVQGIAAIAGGMGKSLFTTQELTEMRDKLAAELEAWHKRKWMQNTPEYRRLSDSYFLVQQKLKSAAR